jgi:nitrous oxidase accessory protein
VTCQSAFWCFLCLFLLAGISFPGQAISITVHAGDDLQAAINGAAPNDTLLVEAGTYQGNFMVAKPLTLQGTGMPVLDGKNTLNKDTLTLEAEGICLEGFMITNSSRAGINVSSDANVIRHNEVVHNDRYGIAVWRSSGNLIEDNNCSDSHGTISRNGIGVYLSSAPATRMVNNTLLQNRKNGIQTSYASYLVLEGNRIASPGGSSGGGHGIRIDDSAFVTGRDLQISDCLLDGLYLNNASNSVFQNLIIDNASTAVFLSRTDNTTFTKMIIQNSSVGIDLSSSGATIPNQIYHASFTANGQHIRSTSSMTIWNSTVPLPYEFEGHYFENYTGSYWDTYPYVDEDEDGIGDEPYLITTGQSDGFPLIAPLQFFDWNPEPPDETPPSPVTNLSGIPLGPTSFCWTWNDPPEADLDHLVLFLNGTFHGNLSPGTEILTLDTLTPSTEYTLGILTVDGAGNQNTVWVNHTGFTPAIPDPTPSVTTIPSPTETVTTVPPPSGTATPSPTITSPETAAPAPPVSKRNTRYIPPPTSAQSATATPPPTTPYLLPPPSPVITIPEITVPPSAADIPPLWITEILHPEVIALIGGGGILGYLLYRKKR